MRAHRVLVVEDDAHIREALMDLLEDHGYHPVGAANGREALDVLRNSDVQPPCLILLDLMMPEMDGREFRREQLDNPEFSRIPVVVLSAYRDVAAEIRDMQLTDYLKKPVRFSELLKMARQHCAAD
jgi:two-component system, chemotaxis family, chemotaxis protein CheY